jgi:hypothetical protein
VNGLAERAACIAKLAPVDLRLIYILGTLLVNLPAADLLLTRQYTDCS